MQALIDTNIFVQYIAKTDELSLKKISDLIKIYDKFIINDSLFFESVFILENRLIDENGEAVGNRSLGEPSRSLVHTKKKVT